MSHTSISFCAQLVLASIAVLAIEPASPPSRPHASAAEPSSSTSNARPAKAAPPSWFHVSDPTIERLDAGTTWKTYSRGRTAVVMLEHEVGRSGGAGGETAGQITPRIRVDAAKAANASRVRVRTSRVVSPRGTLSGVAELDGQSFSLAEFANVTTEREITLRPGEPLELEPIDGSVRASGVGGAWARTMVVVTALDPGSSDDEDEEVNDEDDDESCDDPCDEGDQVGDGLWLDLALGVVSASVPVMSTVAYDRTELDFYLTYQSDRAYRSTVVGHGWTHSYNQFIQLTGGAVVYFDAEGRRNAFNWQGSGYDQPIGRDLYLYWVTDHFEIHRSDGSREIFDSITDKISSIVDRRGRTTRFTYTDGNLTTITSPHGREVALSYDWLDRLETVTEPSGAMTTFYYDSFGNLSYVYDDEFNYIEYEYDFDSRIVREQLRNGVAYTAEYTYVGSSEVHRLYDDNGSLIAEAMSPMGFPLTDMDFIHPDSVAIVDGRGLSWTYERDNIGRIERMIAPNGMQRVRTYGGPFSGPNRNRLVGVTNENNDTRYMSWNANGRLAAVTDEAGNVVQYEYAHPTIPALMTSRTEPDDDVWTYQYDPVNGDLLASIDPLDDTPTYGADRYMQLAYETWPETAGVPVGSPPLPGRLKTVYRADENMSIEKVSYGPAGNMTSVTRGFTALNLATTFQYDANGRCTLKRQNRGDQWVETAYEYDTLGRKTAEIVDPQGLALTTILDYDEHGNLVGSTDPKGVTTIFEYDHRNRLASRIDAASTIARTTAWEFDGNNNLVLETKTGGTTKSFEYNDQNYLVETVDAEGYVELMTRDGVGNVTLYRRSLDPGAGGPFYEIEAEYDAIQRQTARIVAPQTLQLRTEFYYEAPQGCGCGGGTPGDRLVHKVIDASGELTYFTYDELDRRTSRIAKFGDASALPDANDAVTSWEYDAGGNVRATVGPEGERTEYGFDAVNRRTSIVSKDATQGDVTLGYAYDGSDNVSAVTLPNGHVATFDYDGANRLTSSSDSIGTAVSFTYDENGNVLTRSTGIGGQVSTFVYDDLGRVVTAIDPTNGAANPLTFAYDARDNVIERIDNRNTKTKYAYDKIDRLIRTTRYSSKFMQIGDNTINTQTKLSWNGLNVTEFEDHDGNATTFFYDDAMRVTQESSPLANGTGVGVTAWTYNAVDDVATRTDAEGVETTYVYDDLHRLTSRQYSTGKSVVYTYDRSGRATSADDGSFRTDLTYDAIGRPETYTTTYGVGGPSYTVTRSYTATVGDIHAQFGYPTGRVVTYGYDARMQLDTVDGGAGVGATYGYDAAGRRIGETLGNGVASILDWDLNNRMTRIRHAKDVTTLFDVELGYNANGHRTWLQDNLRIDRSEVVTYDKLDRIRTVNRGVINASHSAITTPLIDAGVPSTENWENLDRRSNWKQLATTISGGTPTTQTRTVNAGNEYTQLDPDGSGPIAPIPLDHDLDGNLIDDPTARSFGDSGGANGQTYEYDEEHRLRKVRRKSDNFLLLEIRYDGFGIRVESVDHLGLSSPCGGGAVTTRHINAGNTPVAEYASCNGGGTWLLAREWIMGSTLRVPVAMVDWTAVGAVGVGSPEVLHYLRDAIGNIVALTDAVGAVVERYEYTAYGQTFITRPNGVRVPTSFYGNVFGYTSHRYDSGVKLYHTRYRTYSPRLGRWLQRDPAGFVDGINRYEYAISNPLNWIDPLGLCIGGCNGGGGSGGSGSGGSGSGGSGSGGGGSGGSGGGSGSGSGAGSDTGYSITVHVDQPGSGGDRDTYEGIFSPDVGHTFVTVTNHGTGESTTAGFYPNSSAPGGDGVNPVTGNTTDPGAVVDDTTTGTDGGQHGSDVSKTYPITKDQYDKAKEKIDKDKKSPPTYDLDKNNCTDWAIGVAATAGVCLPDTQGKWPGGGGSNPGDLGEDLRGQGGTTGGGSGGGGSSSKDCPAEGGGGGGGSGGGGSGGGQQGGGGGSSGGGGKK